MKIVFAGIVVFAVLIGGLGGVVSGAALSDATKACLECHSIIHPGIVEDWQKSRHSQMSPSDALGVKGPGLKVSSRDIPDGLKGKAVGCAECHSMRPKEHADAFDHNDHKVYTAVSPGDCRVCHSEEAEQYSMNLMSHAYGNLSENKLYGLLEHSILGAVGRDKAEMENAPASRATRAETCYHCHGTVLKITGKEKRTYDDYGDMEFPRIEGWPNQGTGRVNLDGTIGSCAACHTRHRFSIETARKPYTCKQCHVGPDVPAFKVYEASKHGNIFSSHGRDWEFSKVPWTVGKDFSAPTCAACHVSLLVSSDGELIAKRSHRMNDRLPWRIFGLIYAHPHPKNPDITIIRNKDGLPLPSDFAGGFAADYLIDIKEMEARRKGIQTICRACHGSSTVAGQWERFESSIKETNAKTLTATQILIGIWAEGYAKGPSEGGSPFDEEPERVWADSWVIYANTIRLASAMGFGGDYGVFADGRYELNKTIVRLHDYVRQRKRAPQ